MQGQADAGFDEGVVLLDHFGVIEVSGDDAVKFLHGQLTQDVSLLEAGQARLAAYCSPKGRMLASFVLVKESVHTVYLVCPKDVLASTLKRLTMFVMRAKVQLQDASARFSLWGLLGNACQTQSMPADTAAWRATAVDGGHLVALPPGAQIPRQLLLSTVLTTVPAGTVVNKSVWEWCEVLSGVAHVVQATAEAFVPQMLNYESVGGVNFKKGCYPGQEVVARSQFRGTLKRRTYVVQSTGPLAVGQTVRAADNEDVGQVVLAAPSPQGVWLALVCLQTSFSQSPDLEAAGGGRLTVLSLPYALLEDV